PSLSARSTSSGYCVSAGPVAAWIASSPTCGPLPWVTTRRWPARTISAKAAAALCTLARWFAAESRSPRFNSALPPRAATISMASGPHRGDQDRLDRVHPVLRLVEDDRGRGFEHLLGHFHAVDPEAPGDVGADLGLGVVEGRQAVHELHEGIAGRFHERRGDAIGDEQLDPFGP